MGTIKIRDKEYNITDAEEALIVTLQELILALKYLGRKHG